MEKYNCPICGKLNEIIQMRHIICYLRYECNCGLSSTIYMDGFIINYSINNKYQITIFYNSIDKQYLNQIDGYNSGRALMQDFKSSSIEFPFTEEYIKSLLILS